jgi:DNA-binding MarR family transcriptional regulator
MNANAVVQAIGELFPEIYSRFHVRRPKRGHRPDAGSIGVLQHLQFAGPLTIGEAARHLSRAQSVVSAIVSGLERRGVVARMRDERDRRRVLVWLTPAGIAMLEDDRRVLAPDLLERAVKRMPPAERAALISGMQALVAASTPARSPRRTERDHGASSD